MDPLFRFHAQMGLLGSKQEKMSSYSFASLMVEIFKASLTTKIKRRKTCTLSRHVFRLHFLRTKTAEGRKTILDKLG
jgi:hypothetical protein